MGVWSRWRDLSKTLSGSDKTGIMRKYGPVIEINMEALMLRRGTKNWRQKSRGISLESGKQYFTVDSPRASRQSERTQRREKERAARESIREERLVARVLAK